MKNKLGFHNVIWIILLCLTPILALFMLASMGIYISAWLFLGVLLLCFSLLYFLFSGTKVTDNLEEKKEVVEEAKEIEITNSLLDSFEIKRAYEYHKNLYYEGKLLEKADTVYRKLKQHFENSGYIPMLQKTEGGNATLVLVSHPMKPALQRISKPVINLILFVLTLITTTWAGAAHQGVNIWQEPGKFTVGLPYALALMAILGAHELGHYFMAKRHGILVTLPYFIPIPFALGTFGAFISMKSPVENRRALFDVGIAGPLAGLVIAIPALLIGLKYSTVVLSDSNPSQILGQGMSVTSSVLMAVIAKLALGEAVTAGHNIILHPLAFAGWLGLLVTALNLLPIGQLDGGHIAHALFGRKTGNTIGSVALFSLFLLGIFVWSGWLIWAIIVFFVAGAKSAPPLNDISRVDRKREILGAVAFILLFLIMTPLPHAFYQSLGIHCPYM